jgi:hypothetical protein
LWPHRGNDASRVLSSADNPGVILPQERSIWFLVHPEWAGHYAGITGRIAAPVALVPTIECTPLDGVGLLVI